MTNATSGPPTTATTPRRAAARTRGARTSRKSFLGRLTGREDPHDRVAATVATNVLALERGATVFRVHDVRPTRDALLVAAATLAAAWDRKTNPTTTTT